VKMANRHVLLSRTPSEPQAPVKDSLPSASSGAVGKIYGVRAGAGQKSKLYVCLQNSADGYEWVQVAIST